MSFYYRQHTTTTTMDKKQVISLVTSYKHAIEPIVSNAKVYIYGSYSKGTARQDSDIDVAVIVPELHADWLDVSAQLWNKTRSVSTLIEPILLDAGHQSPLYDDIMRTGIAV